MSKIVSLFILYIIKKNREARVKLQKEKKLGILFDSTSDIGVCRTPAFILRSLWLSFIITI